MVKERKKEKKRKQKENVRCERNKETNKKEGR